MRRNPILAALVVAAASLPGCRSGTDSGSAERRADQVDRGLPDPDPDADDPFILEPGEVPFPERLER